MASAALKSLQNPDLLITSGLVAGEWRAPEGKTFSVYDPSTGLTLQECANLGFQDFVDAIDSAEKGMAVYYKSTTAEQRGQILHQWYNLVMANVDDLATILCLENGKTLAEARGEIIYAASFISWFAEESRRSYGDTIPSSHPNSTVLTYKEPIGVCGIITPWNFPAAMITRKIAPALAAGCSVVIKPPSETPFSALALARLAIEAGVPEDCIHVVPTKDRQASMELATNPKIKKLSFTGSTNVGKMLTKAAAGTMKRVGMELGGNAPFIVFEDANLDDAVDGAMICKFRCSGQTCVCANRLLVHESVKDIFVTKLVERVNSLKLGAGIDPNTTQGPLVNASAVDNVEQHVKDMLDQGGILHTGGKRPQGLTGYFYEPTVISEATVDMNVATDETFGPLAAIFAFKTEEEAIQMANSTELGLSGYIFTENLKRAMRVSRKLEVGMVGINTGLISAAETPFGGIKESGEGREGSKYGLGEYQTVKAITIGQLHT